MNTKKRSLSAVLLPIIYEFDAKIEALRALYHDVPPDHRREVVTEMEVWTAAKRIMYKHVQQEGL